MATYTQCQGYPKYIDDKNGKSIIDRYHCPKADLTSTTTYKIGAECSLDKSLTLSKIDRETDEGNNRGYLTLTYAPADQGQDVDSNKNEYTLDESALEKSIETHASYLMKWNHHLAGKKGQSKPGWFDTAKTFSDTSESKLFQWVRDYSEVDVTMLGRDFIKWDKIKPGVESYVLPSPVVSATLYFSTSKKAYSSDYEVGKKTAPKEKFGISGGEWLVTGRRVYKSGKKWVAQVNFTWAKTWDGDLYAS